MAASQLALADRRVIICFVPNVKHHYRDYSHQAHTVFSNARIVIGDDQYPLPSLVYRLHDKRHTFKHYDILLSYFCHELVSASTHIYSPNDEVPEIEDIKEIGDHLRALNTETIHKVIAKTYPDERTCTECIKKLTLLYMKTTLEHRFMFLDAKYNFYHSERVHEFGKWVAKCLFNHDTIFFKTSGVHCRILHIVYTSLLQETYFYSEVTKLFRAIEDELELYLGEHPVTDELLVLRGKEDTRLKKKKKNQCALEFILDYMHYNVDKTRKIFWVVAYLVICRAALANNGVFNRTKTTSLLFYNERCTRFHPFYFKSAKTQELLFCSRGTEEEVVI